MTVLESTIAIILAAFAAAETEYTVPGIAADGAPEATSTPTSVPPTPTLVPSTATPMWPTERALTRAEISSLARAAGFPEWAIPAVLSVSWCESDWKPWVTGDAGERGLMQIHPVHPDSTYDPLGNMRAAYRISSGGTDWSAWTCQP